MTEHDDETLGGEPVAGFPGVFKLSGKERFAIRVDDSETRVVRSWRTVLRFFARKQALGGNPPPKPKPKPAPAPAPAPPPPSTALASPTGKRLRVRTVPFDPTDGALPPRPRAAKRKAAASPTDEGEGEEAQEEDEPIDDGNKSDHTASGGARHWTTEEDNVMLTWMMRLGMGVGKHASEAQWRTVTAKVCKVRFRTLRQVRRRWGFLNPANEAANDATRARRRDQDRLRREAVQELFPETKTPPTKKKKKKKSKAKDAPDPDAGGASNEALTDGMVLEALDAFVVEDDDAPLELAAIEPPLSDDDGPRVKRRPTDPPINYYATHPWQPTGPPRATLCNAVAYTFSQGLGRYPKPFSFVFPPDKRFHIDGRRKYENLLAVPAAALPAAAATLHQNQITDYMLQRKKRAVCHSPLLAALQETTPTEAVGAKHALSSSSD